MTHTAGPWEVQDDGLGGYYINRRIEAGEDLEDSAHDSCVFRVDTEFSGIDYDTLRANAAFIVRACNAHEAMVEALRYFKDAVESGVLVSRGAINDSAHIERMMKQAALALAEGTVKA